MAAAFVPERLGRSPTYDEPPVAIGRGGALTARRPGDPAVSSRHPAAPRGGDPSTKDKSQVEVWTTNTGTVRTSDVRNRCK